MFDPTQAIEIQVRTASGPVQVKVRFPTDAEWAEWFKTREVVMSALGRGASQFDLDPSRASAALYKEIRQEGSPDLHPLEAVDVIDRLGKREVYDTQAEGDELTVHMHVRGGDVEHRLRLPGVREVSEFRRGSSRIVSLPFGKQQVRQRLEPGVELYNSCLVKTTGYSNGSIPAIHKDEAIRSVLTFLENEADEGNG